MPTWRGEEFLERVLSALAQQRCELPWDFLAIDSGSDDRTLEILAAAAADFPVPLRVRSIHQVEFDHGDTRNLLASDSQGELLVFLTQDAIPVGEDWLARLARNFDDPRVGGAYCRNLPRPDARPVTKLLSAGDPGYSAGRRELSLPADYAQLDPHARRLLYNFNDVASAVRRSFWERHPFPRTWFGEDVLMARALLEDGWTVVYDDEAAVEHSHDYDAEEVRARATIDGRFSAEWLDRICVGSKSDARTLCERFEAEDARAIEASGAQGAEARAQEQEARALRAAAFEGLYEGGTSARRYPHTVALQKRALKILYVLHGFPPETWAGTEIYTQNLALEMQRLGHECVVFTRSPAQGDEPDFSLREDEFQGLRVLRMTQRLQHPSLRESYQEPRAEAVFREVLAQEQPDLVHFQHLIHNSIGLVEIAQEQDLPTVVHCHDYWSLCARVQLIRPDGVRCEHNMGAGCLLCVKEQHYAHIPRVHKLGQLGRPLLDALASGGRRLGSERSKRRWDGFADIRDRHELVTSAYARADLRISPSRFLREKLLESGAFEPHTFLFSDNGMRTDHVAALEKRPDPQGRVRFGFVGSLVWYKGGECMVRAMAELADAPAVLRVHGGFDPESDPHHAELQALAGDNVEFLGRFDNSRLSEVYAEIDVLIVPSIWFENSPITIHEAHLTRTPVVCSDIGGMAEYVRDGVDGLHFAVGDASDLARVLRRFTDRPELVEELSREFPTIKTIEENARETEFRYRALCCVQRAREPRLLLEAAGQARSRTEGPTVDQGADYLLLRPGGGAAEFDLPEPLSGAGEVVVDLFALGVEPGVQLGGRVLLDGRELGRIEPFAARGQDELSEHRFAFHLLPSEPRCEAIQIEASDAT